MKRMLLNHTVQWTMLFLFCCCLAYGVNLLWQPGKSPLASTDASFKDIPNDVPQTSEQHIPLPLSNRLVEYHIAVKLKPVTHTLQAIEEMTWRNPGTKPVNEVYLHLYPNAFESKQTTFNVESGGKLREDKMTSQSVGNINIESIQTTSGVNLSANESYVQPDDNNTNDHTLMKVLLNEPVVPGEKVNLIVRFSVKLPYVFARMGYAGNFNMVGQWFPKFAVYEPAGVGGRIQEGWDLHQYHGNSEFYADFGIYDVSIQVPKNDIVAATGFPVKPASIENNIKTYHFYADDVHDFAWAASPDFLYYEAPFSTPNLPGVKIKLYLDPKHKNLESRYMQAAKNALKSYTQWYGAYPYSTLSIVVPPGNANGAGGMEYPTLVTAWGASSENAGLGLERVIVHEIGHQFWYGMVASNEFAEAWLDEGFTSYSEDKVMAQDYGVLPNLPLEAVYITSPEPLKQNAWDYGQQEYAENVYTRAKLVLDTIEQEIGSNLMEKTLKTYFQTWQFRHPTTADFQAVLEKVTGKSWQTFFNDFVYNGRTLDYAVDHIQVHKTTQQAQLFYKSEIKIVSLGVSNPSVPIQFHFSDGTTLNKVWSDTSGSEITYKIEYTSPVDWVRIDPQHTLLLESNLINNFLKTKVDPQTAIRWNMSFEKIIETLAAWVSW